MEHQIIIPLDEYNELIKIKKEFQKAFDEKTTILFHDSYFPGHSGYPAHRFSIVTNDVFAKDLQAKCVRLEKRINELVTENCKLRNKKAWFS